MAYARFHHQYRFPDAALAGLRLGRRFGRLRDATAKFAADPTDFPIESGESEQFSRAFAAQWFAGPAIFVAAKFERFAVDAVAEFFAFQRGAFNAVAVQSIEHAVVAFAIGPERHAANAVAIQCGRNALVTVVVFGAG